MKWLKCTDQTRMLSYVLLTVYFLYGMVKIPLVEYVTSLSVGAVVYGVTGCIEFSVLALLVSTLLLPMFRGSNEGFATTVPAAGASPASLPAAGASPVTGAGAGAGAGAATSGVSGTVSPTVAASSDVNSTSLTQGNSALSTGSSTPASTVTNPQVKTINEKTAPANQPADLINEKFEDSQTQTGGLFKLGKIPADEKGGFHIDTGTSVLNALKSLKPDQISAMTQDTKQLIETQKTLMNMLQSFKPMMTEGKEMMDTFQQMFSSNGSAAGAIQAAQDTLKSQ